MGGEIFQKLGISLMNDLKTKVKLSVTAANLATRDEEYKAMGLNDNKKTDEKVAAAQEIVYADA